jgi:hypothetical protein
MKKEDIENVMEIILKDANKREQDAGFSGSHSDGGASRLREQVEFYKYGIDGLVPPECNKYITDYINEKDPDYSEYIRLKEKFENGRN